MKVISVSTVDEWRTWLEVHGESEGEVWLVIQHQDSGVPSPRYHEAIEHALCFGWIDSHARKHDPDSSMLRFTPRKPQSTWSRVNRERAARMTALGLMTERGQALIDLARERGTWQVLADDEVPADLRTALDADKVAADNFAAFPPSSRRLILEWIVTAKRPETRLRRISETVALAAQNLRAHHAATRRPAAS
jgi:uncharacterized protein YdeI (YjbR/CyaY-like superfamily)